MEIEKGNVEVLNKNEREFLLNLMDNSNKDFTYAHICEKCEGLWGQSGMKRVYYYFNNNKSDETYKCKKCGHGILVKRIFNRKDLE